MTFPEYQREAAQREGPQPAKDTSHDAGAYRAVLQSQLQGTDNWKHRGVGMLCASCISFVPKLADNEMTGPRLGRCRKHAPTHQGFPAVFENDWCGDHKLDENKPR